MERQPFEWEESDIERLIDNKVSESTSLDYKRCDALIEHKKQTRQQIISEMSKDISSFANAEGGTIVYGIIEENHLPKAIDEGYDPTIVRREWLEDVIDSNVKRKIDGLRIKQIELKSHKPGRVIYIIHVPQSLQGAIQANDFRYYQRRNFKSEPMEDYQVRDIMNRFKHPLLLPVLTYKVSKDEPFFIEYELVLDLVNKGVVTAKRFGMDMFFPSFSAPVIPNYEHKRVVDIKIFSPQEPYRKYTGYVFRNTEVLFPGESKEIFGPYGNDRLFYKIMDDKWQESYKWKIYVTTYADDMPPKRSEYPFSEFQKFEAKEK